MIKTFNRKPNRLPYKPLYAKNNQYFVTICVQDQTCIFDIISGFGNVIKNGVALSLKNGNTVVASTSLIVVKWLTNVGNMYDNLIVDQWVIMPNHIHFVIGFNGVPYSKYTHKPVNLGDIIKSFKIHTQKQIVEATTVSPFCKDNASPFFNTNPSPFPTGFNYHKIWQKSFYDHIVRDEKDLMRIQEYIIHNPMQWEIDELNPKNSKLILTNLKKNH